MLHRLMLQNALIAALAASVLAATPALAKPVHGPPQFSESLDATSPRTWSPADNLPAYPTPKTATPYKIQDGRSADARDAAKDAAIQPGQPTWPTNPRALTSPRPGGSVRGGTTDNDDIWVVLGAALACTALAGGAAGAARHSRLRARRVAVQS
jgi:hypothetical protein